MNYLKIAGLVILLASCRTLDKSKSKDKTNVSSEVKTEIKEVVRTEYRDTGKIVTEIEYRLIYDTIRQKFVEYKWRERISENKAISATQNQNKVINQESKKDSTEVSFQSNIKKKSIVQEPMLWVGIFFIIIGLYFAKKYLKF